MHRSGSCFAACLMAAAFALASTAPAAADSPPAAGLEASVAVLRDALERVAVQRGQDRRAVLAEVDRLRDAAKRSPEQAPALLGQAYALVRAEIRLLAQEQNVPRSETPSATQRAPTKQSYERVRDSAGALRDALLRLSQEAGREGATAQVATVDRLLVDAATAADGERWEAAQGLATQAMDAARAAVRQIREGTTQVRALVFATPADEYRYELDRYASYRMLFESTVAAETINETIAARRQEAESRFAAAEAEAAAGNYAKAITLLEEASQRWIAAMRAAGIYLPG